MDQRFQLSASLLNRNRSPFRFLTANRRRCDFVAWLDAANQPPTAWSWVMVPTLLE